METYILFYSNYCANCKELIQSLYKSPFFEKFQKICVDSHKNIPKEITSIPAIIVPRMTKVLVGTEAFHWLRGMNQIYLQEEEKKTILLNSLNDRQQEVMNILSKSWNEDCGKCTVEIVAGTMLNRGPDEDTKRKVRATLEQLKDKGLVQKEMVSGDHGQFAVFWPTEKHKAEGPEGSEALGVGLIEVDDECPF